MTVLSSAQRQQNERPIKSDLNTPPNQKNTFTRADASINPPSMGGHDNGRSILQRRLFDEADSYLAYSTYGSFG